MKLKNWNVIKSKKHDLSWEFSACFFIFFVLGSFPLHATGQEETPSQDSISACVEAVAVVDALGREVFVPQPVRSIVTMNSGLSEVVAALGASDRVVGRCSYSTFPSVMRRIPVVGRNSSAPNMETLVAMNPDLVIADAMFDEGKIETLEKRGVRVIIESTSNPQRIPTLVQNLSEVLGVPERGKELLSIVNQAVEQVRQAVAQVETNPKPVVFFENRKPNKSASALSGHDEFISTAGGRNIAANEPVKYPSLSPEFIAMENPEVILRRVSGDIDEEAMEAMRQSVLERPSLQSTQAIQEQRVYVVKSDLFIALRYPVGMAYFAQLFYPGILPLNPDELHHRFVNDVFGEGEWERIQEIYVHPKE